MSPIAAAVGLRSDGPSDAAAIAAIYRQAIAERAATFDTGWARETAGRG